jgi:hypothetical protein
MKEGGVALANSTMATSSFLEPVFPEQKEVEHREMDVR